MVPLGPVVLDLFLAAVAKVIIISISVSVSDNLILSEILKI